MKVRIYHVELASNLGPPAVPVALHKGKQAMYVIKSMIHHVELASHHVLRVARSGPLWVQTSKIYHELAHFPSRIDLSRLRQPPLHANEQRMP